MLGKGRRRIVMAAATAGLCLLPAAVTVIEADATSASAVTRQWMVNVQRVENSGASGVAVHRLYRWAQVAAASFPRSLHPVGFDANAALWIPASRTHSHALPEAMHSYQSALVAQLKSAMLSAPTPTSSALPKTAFAKLLRLVADPGAREGWQQISDILASQQTLRYLQAQAAGLVAAGVRLHQFVRPGRVNVAFAPLLLANDQHHTLAGLSYLLAAARAVSPPPCNAFCQLVGDGDTFANNLEKLVLDVLGLVQQLLVEACYTDAYQTWVNVNDYRTELITGTAEVNCPASHITATVTLTREPVCSDCSGRLDLRTTTTCLQSGGFCSISINNSGSLARPGECWITRGDGSWTDEGGVTKAGAKTNFSPPYCVP